jgi:hypothetical protein
MPVYWITFYLLSNKFQISLPPVHYVDGYLPLFCRPVRDCRCCSASVRGSGKRKIFKPMSRRAIAENARSI